jgi:hypothetical protein
VAPMSDSIAARSVLGVIERRRRGEPTGTEIDHASEPS